MTGAIPDVEAVKARLRKSNDPDASVILEQFAKHERQLEMFRYEFPVTSRELITQLRTENADAHLAQQRAEAQRDAAQAEVARLREGRSMRLAFLAGRGSMRDAEPITDDEAAWLDWSASVTATLSALLQPDPAGGA